MLSCIPALQSIPPIPAPCCNNKKLNEKHFPPLKIHYSPCHQSFLTAAFFFFNFNLFFCWVQWGCFPILITRSYQWNPLPSASPQPPEAAGEGVISIWTGMEQSPGHRLGRCPSSRPCGRQEGSANERYWGKNGLDWSLAGPMNSRSLCVR